MGLKIKETTLRRGGESTLGPDGRTGKRTFLVQYEATTPPANLAAVETANDGTTAIPTARTATTAGSTYPGDATRYCSKVSVAPDAAANDGLTFVVTCEYVDSLNPFDEKGEDPLEDPDEIDWGAAEGTEPYFYDRTSPTPKPVVNTAGQPFDEFRERERGMLLVTVKRNVAAFPASDAYTFMYAVNSDDFTLDGATIPAGTARIGVITCGPWQERNGVQYRVATIPIKLNPDGWDDKLRSYGYSELVSGKLRPILDGANVQVTRPWPLKTDGTRKANATDVGDEITFVPYKKLSYAPFAFS